MTRLSKSFANQLSNQLYLWRKW